MENTQESTQVPSAQIEQVSQFQESLTPTLLKENESAYESVRDLRKHSRLRMFWILPWPVLMGQEKFCITHSDVFERWKMELSAHILSNIGWRQTSKTKDEETEDQQELLDNQTSEKSTGKDNFDDRDSENYKEKLNRRIEYSILQQLIYRETIDTLPNSRFKRITHYPKTYIEISMWFYRNDSCICNPFRT